MPDYIFIKKRTFKDERLKTSFNISFINTDRTILIVLAFYSIFCAFFLSTWHNYVEWGMYLGATSLTISIYLHYFKNGTRLSRSIIGLLSALFYLLVVIQTEGIGEAHLLLIANILLLCQYRDFLPLLVNLVTSGGLITWATHLQYTNTALSNNNITVFRWGENTDYSYFAPLIIIYAVLLTAFYFGRRFIAQRNHNVLEHYALSNMVQQSYHGDLSTDQANHAHSKLVQQASDIFEKINFTLSSLDSISQQLVEQSGQFSDAAQSLGDSASLQQHELSNLALSLDSMSVATKQVARSVMTNNVSSKSNVRLIQSSIQATRTFRENVFQLAQQIRGSYRAVSKLENGSRQIDNILSSIKGVSEQTSILALNAAIESSRVGSEGKGFALVAEEVRALSQRTHSALAEIATLVSHFHQNAVIAVEQIDHCSQLALTTVNDAAFVQNNFVNIAKTNLTIQEGMDDITQSVKQQATSYREIKDRSDELNATADPMASNVQNIQAYTLQLRHLSNQMAGLLDQFELRPQA
jgi:methyl-accepting chemotaxis protein